MAENPHAADESAGELGQLVRRGVKSTLARWVLHRRRRGTIAEGPSTRDEGTHRWDGRRRFAEDYAFVAAQPGLGLVLRTEWLPGRAAHRVWVALLEQDAVHVTPAMLDERPGLVRGQHEPWKVGGVHLDCVAPHARWLARYDGDLMNEQAGETHRAAVDLTFVRRAAPFVPGSHDDPELIARNVGSAEWDARLLRGLRRGSNRGYVQLGEIHGTISLGSRMIPVRATALRQHSWGVRDWGASDTAVQGLIAAADGHRAWLHRARFPWMTLEGGFVAKPGSDGERVPTAVRALGLTREDTPQGPAARVSVHVDYGGDHETDASSSLDASADVLSTLALDVDGRGRLELSLLAMADGGCGMWAEQRRLLPRAPTADTPP